MRVRVGALLPNDSAPVLLINRRFDYSSEMYWLCRSAGRAKPDSVLALAA